MEDAPSEEAEKLKHIEDFIKEDDSRKKKEREKDLRM